MGRAQVSSKIVNRIAGFFERFPERRETLVVVFVLVALIFAVGNLPWHLDNYDQAKQAYVAFEISKTGELWFQHTPQGLYASKPPLMAWVSAGFHAIGIPWDFAWRLPSFLCAWALLILLARESRSLLGQAGATLAIAAFGLNLLTPRLATLVRTDMMLGFLIFLAGWMIYRKLRTGTDWTQRERWGMFVVMIGALFTKGPVIYAFLLPGFILFICLNREKRSLAWSGWWTWFIPLIFFFGWLAAGLLADPAFYDDVVAREFLSRFQEGSRDDERSQPLWFYLPHLLHKFAPWSLLLLGFVLCFPEIRRGLRERPQIFWLVLWSMGGLLFMTFVPAKRVDRIFPVVPPLCLLSIEFCALVWKDRHARIAAGMAVMAGMLFAGGYFIGLVPLSYYEHTDSLVNFSRRARELAHIHGISQITLPRTRDEGLLLYFETLGFADKSDTFHTWKAGESGALVLSERAVPQFIKELGPRTPALDSEPLNQKNEKRYYLFLQE